MNELIKEYDDFLKRTERAPSLLSVIYFWEFKFGTASESEEIDAFWAHYQKTKTP